MPYLHGKVAVASSVDGSLEVVGSLSITTTLQGECVAFFVPTTSEGATMLSSAISKHLPVQVTFSTLPDVLSLTWSEALLSVCELESRESESFRPE